jgi:heptosyltransferase-2
MRFLIIRFSSIGDIVLTTPVIRCIKLQIPKAEVHFLTKSSFKAVTVANPYIDHFHYLENDWDEMIQSLKAQEFDYIIDLHHNLRTAKIKRALNVKAFAFNKLNIKKWLLTAFKVNRLPAIHIVDRCFDTVSTFGVVNDGAGLDYFIPKEEEITLADLPYAHSFGYIGLVIGAAHATKKLPVHQLKKLCSELHHPIILLGGPEDSAIGNEIASVDEVKIYNACGKFTLNESADIVRHAKFIITHDTGLMHIAAALKKPIISIWGNTIPEFGMTPYYGNKAVQQKVFEVPHLSCRPCSKIGYNKCPKRHFKCMEQQDMVEVAALSIQWALGN